MDPVSLGQNGPKVTPVILGANVFGWSVDETRAFQIMDAAVERGLNAFDTADIYTFWGEGNQGGESDLPSSRGKRAIFRSFRNFDETVALEQGLKIDRPTRLGRLHWQDHRLFQRQGSAIPGFIPGSIGAFDPELPSGERVFSPQKTEGGEIYGGGEIEVDVLPPTARIGPAVGADIFATEFSFVGNLESVLDQGTNLGSRAVGSFLDAAVD